MRFASLPKGFFVVASLICTTAAGLWGCGAADPAPSTGSGGGGGAASSNGGSSNNSGSGGSSTNTGGSNAQGGSAGASQGTGGTTTSGTAIALPLVVTTFYNNQGWFGDEEVSKEFKPGTTIIKQADSTSGPCAMRPANAKGRCVKVEYAPPAGLKVPTGGGYVGVFFLTTLAKAHPELMPPAKAGDANWGAEPGKNIAPGATKISFSATSETAGASVSFKAGTSGTGGDMFVVPETPQTLTTAWKEYELPLDGQPYGNSVVGGFAWVIKDTTKPVTFYLDNIIWQ